MGQAIPISQIVNDIPGVVGTGGNPLALNSVLLTTNVLQPSGSALSFSSAAAVGAYFGMASSEYQWAQVYFAGFLNCTQLPLTLYTWKWNSAPVAAWLNGSSLSSMTLTQLQAINGTLSVTIDGAVKTGTVNLTGAASFSAAASTIATALSLSGAQACAWNSTGSYFSITSGTTGLTSTITLGTGTAAAALGFASGIVSQGDTTDTPAGVMTAIQAALTNWAVFSHLFTPTYAQMSAFATWNQTQNDQYLYVAWDNDAIASYQTANNSATLGAIFQAAQYDGAIVAYNSPYVAASICGWAASIDWNATNGRATLAFRQNPTLSGVLTANGLAPVNNQTSATNILSNYATYFGQYTAAGASNNYQILYNGALNGSRFLWADTYVNQIFLNSQLKLGIFTGLLSVNSSPYNDLGYGLMRAWTQPSVVQAKNNGTIRAGILLSASQIAQIAAAAGKDISGPLQTNGYYLQILPASTQVRGLRQSPPATLWYTDGQAIQQVTLNSIVVE
jgi:hypothetical protein